MTEQKTIAINGKDYEVDSLSDTVKTLLNIYSQWSTERDEAVKAFNEAKLSVAKHDAALRDLSKEIVETVEAPSKPEEKTEAPKLEIVKPKKASKAK